MFHEDFPAGVIITNGLGLSCNELILGEFHLFIGQIIIVPVPGGGGGTTGRGIATYQGPLTPHQPLSNNFRVIIKLKLGRREVVREYIVKPKKAIFAAKVLNFLESTRKRISVTATNILQTTKSATVALRNLGRKKATVTVKNLDKKR